MKSSNPNQPPAKRTCACGIEFVPTEAQIRWRRYRCANCTAVANRKARSGDYARKPTDPEWQREYQKRPEVADRRNAQTRESRRNPETSHKHRARDLLRSAVRWGRFVRQPCEVCGAKAEGHHGDYSRPYDVRWLCKKHHNQIHHPKSHE